MSIAFLLIMVFALGVCCGLSSPQGIKFYLVDRRVPPKRKSTKTATPRKKKEEKQTDLPLTPP